MEQLRQGLGKVREITGELPTTNVDGSSYTHGPEDHFLFYITDDAQLITDEARFNELVVLSPPIAAELVDGKFSNTVNVDALQHGVWHLTYSTVNVDGEQTLEGPINRTGYLSLEILPPLVAPNPPTIG